MNFPLDHIHPRAENAVSRASRFGQNLFPCEKEIRIEAIVGKVRRLIGSGRSPTIFPGLSMRFHSSMRNVVAASLLWIVSVQGASATGVEPVKDLRIDPAPCLAAARALDDDKIVNACGALIDHEKTEKADRIKALIARAEALERKGMGYRAIRDYGDVLRLDPAHADTLNARGELWRKKGELPRALADFAAAIKVNPEHAAAKANHRSMAQELERLGALKAVAGKPSFDCATARRKVEKAICANPELADLERDVHVSYVRATREDQTPSQARALRRAQEEFIAHRNASFGRPDYDLQKAMKRRLQQLNGIDGY